MFAPRYTITNSILRNISSSDSSRELIANSYLIPAWESKLKSEAYEELVISGVALEGNKCGEEEIKEILAGQNSELMDLDYQEVINLSKALNYLDEMAKTDHVYLSMEILLETHKLLTEGIAAEQNRGVFRYSQIILKEQRSGKISYSPPPAVEVPFLLEDLLNWLNLEDQKDIHPIIKSCLTHFEIWRIHPFVAYSNQLARLISQLILWTNSYKINGYLSLEGYFNETSQNYYSILHSVANQQVLDTHDRDLTPFLEYFSFGVASEMGKLKNKIRQISQTTLAKDQLGEELILNDRQIAIMEYLRKYHDMRNRDFRKIFPDYSDDTVLRELMILRKKGLVERTGRTKKATYILTREKPTG